MDTKNFFENFETIANAPGGTSLLREMILNLAVRGILVPQYVEEGDTSSLLSLCAESEELLVKDGLINQPRFQRGEPVLEIPYPIPATWVWVRLGDISAVVGGGTPSTTNPKYWATGEDLPWITPADMRTQVSRYVSRGSRDITQLGLEGSSAQLLPAGSVLFSSRAPIGHVGIAAKPLATNQGFKSCVPYLAEMSEFIYLFLRKAGKEIDAMATGTTFREVSGKQVAQVLIPLPPLDEQKRIVAKVDELMQMCFEFEAARLHRNSVRTAARKSAIDSISTATTPDELNAAWKRISDNWLNIADTPESISSLRSLILGLAVRGKLVPQIANEKLLEAVTVNGKFELPNSWNWVKISTVTEFVNGFAFKSEEYCENGIGIVRMSDLKLGQIAVQGMKRVPEKYHTILDENLRVSPGDLVIGMSGSIGKPCFNLTDETFLLNQRVGKFVPHSVDKSYLAIVLQTLEKSFLEMSAGSGIKNLSTKQIKDAELPLPPALEQKRIVSKVAELMTLCDQLDHSLIKRDELAKKIAASSASELAA